MKYEKATAEVTYFDNSDVITTSGGCPTWTSQNGYNCDNGSFRTDTNACMANNSFNPSGY